MKTFLIYSFLILSPVFSPKTAFSQTDDASAYPPNFYQVNAKLYRGGRPTADNLNYLASLGVRTVINLQGGDLRSYLSPIAFFTEPGERRSAILAEGTWAQAAGIANYRNYPLDSLQRVSMHDQQMISEIEADFNNPDLQPIYVHCEHGKDRTGLVVAIERVQDEHWSLEDARAEWIEDGHGLMSRLFTSGLDRYFYAAYGN